MLSLFLSFRPRAYWARCLPEPLASPVPVLVVEIELLKINRFRRKTHLTGILSLVTNLPMLVSCLPFHVWTKEAPLSDRLTIISDRSKCWLSWRSLSCWSSGWPPLRAASVRPLSRQSKRRRAVIQWSGVLFHLCIFAFSLRHKSEDVAAKAGLVLNFPPSSSGRTWP